MTAITATMCSTAQRQGPEDNTDGRRQCVPPSPSLPPPRNGFHVGHMSGPESPTCPPHCQRGRRVVCPVSIPRPRRSDDTRLDAYPGVNQPRCSICRVIFLPRAVSRFNSDSLFEECSFTHYRVLSAPPSTPPVRHNVTGICGLFDPPLHPQT